MTLQEIKKDGWVEKTKDDMKYLEKEAGAYDVRICYWPKQFTVEVYKSRKNNIHTSLGFLSQDSGYRMFSDALQKANELLIKFSKV